MIIKHIALWKLLLIPLVACAADGEPFTVAQLKTYVAKRSHDFSFSIKDQSDLTDHHWDAIGTILEGSSMRETHFCNTHIGDSSVVKLAAAFKTMPQLTFISLYNTGITDVGVASVCAALREKRAEKEYSLRSLNIAGNNLTSLSLRSIIPLLELHSDLSVTDDLSNGDIVALIKQIPAPVSAHSSKEMSEQNDESEEGDLSLGDLIPDVVKDLFAN